MLSMKLSRLKILSMMLIKRKHMLVMMWSRLRTLVQGVESNTGNTKVILGVSEIFSLLNVGEVWY